MAFRKAVTLQKRFKVALDGLSWAARGGALPKHFSVTAICEWRRPKETTVVCTPLLDPSNLYIYVVDGPLAKRTLFLTVNPEPTDDAGSQQPRKPLCSGIFLDGLDPTRITPLPKVTLELPREVCQSFYDALLGAGMNEGRGFSGTTPRLGPSFADGARDWEETLVERPQVLLHFDVEFSLDAPIDTPAAITNFQFESLRRFPTRREWFRGPLPALPIRARGGLGELCYLASRCLPPWVGFRNLFPALKASFTTPRSFCVEAVLKVEPVIPSLFDALYAVRPISITEGPLRSTKMMLRVFDKDWFRSTNDHALLPFPFGPGLAAIECGVEKLSQYAWRRRIDGKGPNGGAQKGPTMLCFETVRNRLGNPEQYGEVRVYLDPQRYRVLTHALDNTKECRVRFTVTLSRWPLAAARVKDFEIDGAFKIDTVQGFGGETSRASGAKRRPELSLVT